MKLGDFNVLLVDDYVDALTTVRLMLRDMGINQIYTARNGAQALKFIDEEPSVNLILCDWNMPKLSGIEFLRQVRSVNLDIPFIMITGRGDVNSVTEAKRFGVNGYILKPFSQAELRKKILEFVTVEN